MYFEVNNSGCSERKGMVQVRYDLFLDEEDHGHEKHFVKVNNSWQNNPFLCHFCQFEPDVTDDEILFVGELAAELAYREWKENRFHGVKNLPVSFPAPNSVTPDRKKSCDDRLDKINKSVLKKNIERGS
jgi:hypothetical protein